MLKLLPSGQINPQFTLPNISFHVESLVKLAYGKIALSELFISVNSVECKYIAGQNNNGSLDESFNPDAEASNSVFW
jgi:hypothetical protein